MRLLLLLLALGVLGAHAGVFLGDVEYTAVQMLANGSRISTKARTLTFECNQGDPTMAYQIGTGLWSVSTCSAPTQSYTTVAKAYVPRSIKIYHARTCAVDVANDYDLNSTVAWDAGLGINDVPGSSMNGRRLLRAEDIVAQASKLKPVYRFMRSTSLTTDVVDHWTRRIGEEFVVHSIRHRHMRGLLDAEAEAQRSCGGIAVGGGFGVVVSAVAVYCPNMVTKQDLKDYASKESIAAWQQQNVNNQTMAWAATQAALANQTAKINGLQAEFNKRIIEAQLAFIKFNNDTLVRFDYMQTEIDILTNGTQSQIVDLNKRLASGLDGAAAYTVSEVTKLQASTNRSFVSVSAQLNATNVRAWLDFNLTGTRLREIVSIMLQIQQALSESSAGSNNAVDRSDKALVWAAVKEMQEDGRIPFLRSTQPGAAPIPLSAQSNNELRVFVEKSLVNYVTSTGGLTPVFTAHQHTVELWCNIDTLTREMPLRTTFESMMTLVGPTSCIDEAAAAGVDPVRTCRCWFEITERTCLTTSTFDWFSITSNTDRNAYLIRDFSTAPGAINTCAAGPGIQYPSYGSATKPAYVTSAAALNTGWLPTVSCRPQTTRGFQVVHTRAGVQRIQQIIAPEVCAVSFYSLFSTTAVMPASLPFAMWVIWTREFLTLTSERAVAEARTYGVRPGGTTSTFDPLTSAYNGRTATCYDTALASIGPTGTEILYRVVPGPLEFLVSTQIWDRAPACTVSGCVIDPLANLISSVTTTAAATIKTPGAPFDQNTILAGELSPSGMSRVYDVPAESISLSPNSQTARGTVGYLRWDIPSSFDVSSTTAAQNPAPGTLDQWEAAHPGEKFDQNAPVSIDYWVWPIDSGTGRCTPLSGFEFNDVCTALETWSIHPNTDMRAGGLVISPDTWQYTVTLNAALGPLTTYVYDGCPQYSFGSGEATGTYLHIVNPSDVQIDVSIARSTDNPTCAVLGNLGNFDVGIAPHQFFDLKIPACGNFTVQVFVKTIDPINPLLSCGPPLSTFVTADTQSNVIPSSLNNNVTEATVLNAVLAANAVVTSELASLFLQLLYDAQTSPLQVNITIDQYVASGLNGTALGAIIQQARDAAANVNLFPSNETRAALARLTADQAAANAAASAATTSAQDVDSRLDDARAEYLLLFAKAEEQRGLLNYALRNSTKALQDVIDAWNALPSGGGDFGNFFTGGLSAAASGIGNVFKSIVGAGGGSCSGLGAITCAISSVLTTLLWIAIAVGAAYLFWKYGLPLLCKRKPQGYQAVGNGDFSAGQMAMIAQSVRDVLRAELPRYGIRTAPDPRVPIAQAPDFEEGGVSGRADLDNDDNVFRHCFRCCRRNE